MSDDFKGEGARDTAPKAAKVFDLPEPEIRAHAIELADCPRGVKTIANAAAKAGWKVLAFHARGPYINSDGSLNRIADSIRLLGVDSRPHGKRSWAAWWATDAHDTFGFENGRIWYRLGVVNATDLKNYIKEATQ